MSSSRLLRRLLAEVGHTPVRLVLAAASLLVLAGAQLGLPWLVKRWVEGPLQGIASGVPYVLAALVLGLVIAASLLSSRLLLADVNQRMLERLRTRAVDRLLAAEPGDVRRYPSGDVMARILQDAGVLSGFAENILRRVLGDGALAAGALGMMLVLDARLAVAALVATPLLGLLLLRLGTVIRRWGAQAQEQMGGVGGVLSEQLRGLSTIKGMQAETREAKRFAEANAIYRRRAVRAEAWTAALMVAVFALATTAVILAIAAGTSQVAAGRISPGGLLAFCLYAGQLVEPLRRLAEVHGMLQRSVAAAERLFELHDLPVPPAAPTPSTSAVHGALRLDGVSFRYHPGRPLLEDVRLAVDAGERIALAAASGGGKSTLAALLQRFLAPLGGSILLDGEDLASLPLETVRRAVCVVEQEPYLMSGPILENVRYGRPQTGRGEVEAAIERVGLGPTVKALPHGLDTTLAEAAANLSGGQRQRLAIARAVLRDPRVLVLDEATSALDGEAEAQLFQALDSWLAARTVIVMAHRLATVRRAPRIAVLEAGRVVEDGAPDELALRRGAFSKLFADQLQDGAGAPANATTGASTDIARR